MTISGLNSWLDLGERNISADQNLKFQLPVADNHRGLAVASADEQTQGVGNGGCAVADEQLA